MSASGKNISDSNHPPHLRILLCDYLQGIWPWIQDDLTTPFWRFYWNPTPGGVLEFQDGSFLELTPDHFTVVPGYLRFSTRARQPFDQFYIHFQFEEPPRQLPRQIFRIPAAAELRAGIEEYPTLSGGVNALRRHILQHYILHAALVALPGECFEVAASRDERVEEAIRLIRRRQADPPSNPELARRLGMSVNGFIRLFRRETGEAPQDFCRRQRLELACELLQYGEDSIEEIALRTGFADRYHFSRAFKRLLRQSPAGFRRQHRRGA